MKQFLVKAITDKGTVYKLHTKKTHRPIRIRLADALTGNFSGAVKVLFVAKRKLTFQRIQLEYAGHLLGKEPLNGERGYTISRKGTMLVTYDFTISRRDWWSWNK
jgi:hypothetical protein